MLAPCVVVRTGCCQSGSNIDDDNSVFHPNTCSSFSTFAHAPRIYSVLWDHLSHSHLCVEQLLGSLVTTVLMGEHLAIQVPSGEVLE